MDARITLGSTCVLAGLTSAVGSALNGAAVEVTGQVGGERVLVALLDPPKGLAQNGMSVKPESLMLCCALPSCLRVQQGPGGDAAKLLGCSGCSAAFYCCKQHQSDDWKSNHKDKCGRLQDQAEVYNLIDIGIPIEQELHRILIQFRVESEYLLQVRKEQLKVDIGFLQNECAREHLSRSGKRLFHDRYFLELHRQLDWCMTVSQTDSEAVLKVKKLLHQVHEVIHRNSRSTVDATGENQRLHQPLWDKFTPAKRARFDQEMNSSLDEKSSYILALTEAVKQKHPTASVANLNDENWLAAIFPNPPTDSTTTTLKANAKVNVAPWYPGPSPLMWEHGWDLLKVKSMGLGAALESSPLRPSFSFAERAGEAPTRDCNQKRLDFHARFYNYNYPKKHWIHLDALTSPGYSALHRQCKPLQYWQHVQLHKQGNAFTRPKKSPPPAADTLMTLHDFLNISIVEYPVLQVAECDHCGKLCLGECLCGEAYCSAECHRRDWNGHENVCTQVLDSAPGYCRFIPMAHGAPIPGHCVYKDRGQAAPQGPTGQQDPVLPAVEAQRLLEKLHSDPAMQGEFDKLQAVPPHEVEGYIAAMRDCEFKRAFVMYAAQFGGRGKG